MKKVDNTTVFPAKIQHYTLFEVLSDINEKSAYHFAIYTNRSGKKFFCKLWTGEKKDQDFTWISNEIGVYQFFDSTYKTHQKEIKKNFPDIKIPKMYVSSIEDSLAYFLTDFIEGKPLEGLSDDKKAVVFQRVIQYFHFMSSLAVSQQKTLRVFGATRLFLLFHYYIIKVALSSKIHYKSLLQILWKFYVGFFELIRTNHLSFVHRDLGFADNIILQGKTIAIIDFQLSVLSNPLMEIANITIALWNEKKLRTKFLNSRYVSSLLDDEGKKKQMNAFLAHAFLVSTALQLNLKKFNGTYMIKRFSPIV